MDVQFCMVILKPDESLDQVSILLVDDESALLNSSRQILCELGNFKIDLALSAKDALEKLSTKKYDTIVSDYQMPEKNGLELLRVLRESENDTPFILFTGKGREEVAIDALNLGADRYFSKIGPVETVYGELAHGITQLVHKKRMENKLKSISSIIEQSSNTIVILDTDEKIVYANPTFLTFHEVSLEDVLGKTWLQIMPEGDSLRKERQDILNTIFKQKKMWKKEICVPYDNGKIAWRNAKIFPLFDEKNNITYVVYDAEDIAEKKKTEDSLRNSEKKHRHFVDSLNEMLFELNKDGQITFANKRMSETLGFSIDELNNMNFLQIIEKDYRQNAMADFERRLQGYNSFNEYFLVKKDGCKFPVVVFGKETINLDGQPVIRGIAINLQELKILQKKTLENDKTYCELINGMKDTVWVIDFDCGFIDVNEAAVNALGYSKDELLSMKIFDIDFTLNQREIKDLVKNMRSIKFQVFETAHTTKKGKTIPVEICSSRVTYKGKKAILSIARDITKRKETEEKLSDTLKELVTINEKMEVISKLTRHDVRNKLSAILNNAYLIKMQLPENPEALRHLTDLELAVDKIATILDFAKAYEQLGAEPLTFVNIGEKFDEALTLQSDLECVTILNKCHNLSIMADSLVRQLLYNFLDNSLTHGESVTKIRLYSKTLDNQLNLIYEDNGIGIPQNQKEKIFYQGYGKGTGLGLYLVKKICENYGWKIQETGVVGNGVKFTITIPEKKYVLI